MLLTDFILVCYVWLLSYFLQLVSFPWLWRYTKRFLPDAGWGLGRLVGWLMLSLPIWFLGNLKLPINTDWGVYLALILWIIFTLSHFYTKRHQLAKTLRNIRPFIITEEILFVIGLFGLSYVRAHNPAILDLEKFMDAGFMASYLRSPTLPAPDMWLAGETINYYSFGHFMGSILTRFWLLPISYSYNILLAFIMGLGLSQSFSFVANLLGGVAKKTTSFPVILGGCVAAFFTVIGGNTHTIWYFLSKGTFVGYWYADATRFIEHTIHEFPSYSFVVSDLHGHVWDFPVVLLFLSLYLVWYLALRSRQTNIRLFLSAIFCGILLGVMTMTNMWDVMIYGMLTAVTGFTLFFADPDQLKTLFVSALTMVVTAGLTAAPFLLRFTAISEGVKLVTERSPVWQLFVLWTGHVTISAIAFILAAAYLYRRSRQKVSHVFNFRTALILSIAVTAWLLLLLPELIYVKDIYTGHPRANTMFKLTYQAFILMSLLGGWAIGFVWLKDQFRTVVRILVTTIIGCVVVAVGLFPYFAYRDYYGALRDYKGLDGWTWLKDQYPDDYNAIEWMNHNVAGQPNILEAWGESYTTFDRVSAYTGLPTVIGWRVHEWLWRGGFDIPGARSSEVDTIFKSPQSAAAHDLLNRYQAKYIFVGAKEREAYPDLNVNAIKTLGTVIFSSGQTFILERPTQTASSL